MISYAIDFANAHAHLFTVTMTVDVPNPEGHVLSLPAWIPGSYMIRDFAKNIVTLTCTQQGRPVPYTLVDKQTWQVAPVTGVLEVTYQVYAFDLSVRTAYLDDERAFFNGSSVFLSLQGQENIPHEVTISADGAPDDWTVNTALPTVSADARGFGAYRAADYDELIDQPVEVAAVEAAQFAVDGVTHALVVTGHKVSDVDAMASDLAKICQAQCDLFGGYPRHYPSATHPEQILAAAEQVVTDAPLNYQFLTMVVDSGYGGLEHRHSTALLCSRKDLLKKGERAHDVMRDDYIQFLGLCSHEYFHTWNIKRIKPQTFLPYQLDQEQYTDALWFYEGVTSYYDDLMLLRSGIIDVPKYLDLLSQGITRVLRCEGRHVQTVTESSFYAWSKFYKQDENASNAIVSYYSKGALVALCLDLQIREKSGHTKSLDDLMRVLWARAQSNRGSDTVDIIREANALANNALDPFFEQALYTTQDLPLEQLLAPMGVDVTLRARVNAKDRGGVSKAEQIHAHLGIEVQDSADGLMVRVCHSNSPAMQAGLSAKDILVALDGRKASEGLMWELLSEREPGEAIVCHVFRRDKLMAFTVTLAEPSKDTCQMSVVDEAAAARWLGAEAFAATK